MSWNTLGASLRDESEVEWEGSGRVHATPTSTHARTYTPTEPPPTHPSDSYSLSHCRVSLARDPFQAMAPNALHPRRHHAAAPLDRRNRAALSRRDVLLGLVAHPH